MSKYKILLPTNGLEVGSIVELEDSVAENYNAGEPTPRVEKVEESPEKGDSEGETDTTTSPESNEDTKTDEGENTGEQQ